MNSYEVAVIIRPDVEEDAQQSLIERLSEMLTAEGGQVDNVDACGDVVGTARQVGRSRRP